MSDDRVMVGDITQWLSGGTPSRSVTSYWNGDIPWISASTLTKAEISESDQHLSVEGLLAGSKMAPVGSTLLLVRGSALYKHLKAGLVVEPVSFNQDIKALVPAPDVVPKYLTYSLLGNRAGLLKMVSTAGNSAGVLDTALVQSFSIRLPCRAEQQSIVEVLSDTDTLLDSLDALVSKKRAIKTAVMQQVLTGKTRLPGFTGKWETKRLGELFWFKNGLNKAKRFFGQGVPIVNYMDVFEHPVLHASELAGRVQLSRQEINNYDVRKGDVFFTRTSETVDEIGMAAAMLDDPLDTVFSGFILRARPLDGSIHDSYKAYCFAAQDVRRQIIATASYTTRALTNGSLLARVHVTLPPVDEQAAIATVLSDMDAEIAALEQRRDKTRAIKQGMMQQLLTGRTRLIEPMETEATG